MEVSTVGNMSPEQELDSPPGASEPDLNNIHLVSHTKELELKENNNNSVNITITQENTNTNSDKMDYYNKVNSPKKSLEFETLNKNASPESIKNNAFKANPSQEHLSTLQSYERPPRKSSPVRSFGSGRSPRLTRNPPFSNSRSLSPSRFSNGVSPKHPRDSNHEPSVNNNHNSYSDTTNPMLSTSPSSSSTLSTVSYRDIRSTSPARFGSGRSPHGRNISPGSKGQRDWAAWPIDQIEQHILKSNPKVEERGRLLPSAALFKGENIAQVISNSIGINPFPSNTNNKDSINDKVHNYTSTASSRSPPIKKSGIPSSKKLTPKYTYEESSRQSSRTKKPGQLDDSSSINSDIYQDNDEPVIRKPVVKKTTKKKKSSSSSSAKNRGKRCSYCSATTTPMWRHGPEGYPDLCNKCGVKYMRGRILNDL